MASSKLIFALIFFLSSIAFLAQKVHSINYLSHACSKSGNFPANGPYAQNLKNLLGELNLKTPPMGFSTSSIGKKPDRTHGLSLCRGDVSRDDCKSCVLAASDEIVKRCPNDKEAIIWYDNCLLKYSDDCFKGEIDNTYKLTLLNTGFATNPDYFNPMVKEMLVCLSEKAHVVQNLYATKQMDFGKNEKLYGLVQCTRDLSKEDCKKCLDDIIVNELPKCCAGRIGGRVVGGSCNFRYEMYPFFNTP